MSSHQALGQSDSGIVSCYTVTCKVLLPQGLEYVWVKIALYPPATHLFLLCTLLSIICFHPHLLHVAVRSEASHLQRAEGQQSDAIRTNNLLAAQERRERETVNEIRD